MQPEAYLEVDSPDEIRLKGHRIWLEHIVTRTRRGMSAVDIVADLPTLTIEEVQGVQRYIELHREDIDAYMARHEAYLAEQERLASETPPSPVMARLRRLRDTLKELGAQEALSQSGHT
jgi:uncharacterized protein (DUF433 family)